MMYKATNTVVHPMVYRSSSKFQYAFIYIDHLLDELDQDNSKYKGVKVSFLGKTDKVPIKRAKDQTFFAGDFKTDLNNVIDWVRNYNYKLLFDWRIHYSIQTVHAYGWREVDGVVRVCDTKDAQYKSYWQWATDDEQLQDILDVAIRDAVKLDKLHAFCKEQGITVFDGYIRIPGSILVSHEVTQVGNDWQILSTEWADNINGFVQPSARQDGNFRCDRFPWEKLLRPLEHSEDEPRSF